MSRISTPSRLIVIAIWIEFITRKIYHLSLLNINEIIIILIDFIFNSLILKL